MCITPSQMRRGLSLEKNMSIFYNKFENEELNKAYELLENVTPLSCDCGKLCANKCCKGSDNDGMLLFPSEKEFFENKPNFKVYYDEKSDCDAVVCLAPCERGERPLSCRLFPLFPYVEEENGEKKLNVALDVRALGVCPLADDKEQLSRKFLRNVRLASAVLLRNSEISDFLHKISKEMLDLGPLAR